MIVARFSLQRTDQTLLAMTRVAFTKTVEHHVRRSTDTDSLHPLVPLIHISRTNTAEQPSLERTKNHHIFTSFNNRARGILALFFTSYRERKTNNKQAKYRRLMSSENHARKIVTSRESFAEQLVGWARARWAHLTVRGSRVSGIARRERERLIILRDHHRRDFALSGVSSRRSKRAG